MAPLDDSWVVSVYEVAAGGEPLGAGVCVDHDRVLTSRHVVDLRHPKEAAEHGQSLQGSHGQGVEPTTTELDGSPRLWVAFPKSDPLTMERRRVANLVYPDEDGDPTIVDVAVLRLAASVPSGVRPAPLRCPRPSSIRGERWWAFGFPRGDAFGNEADGEVAAALAWEWMRLDTTSPYVVEKGFSGAGVWCPGYEESVVGIVGHAHGRGDARALSLYQVDRWLPSEGLRDLATWVAGDAGALALAQWGWSLSTDPEAPRHWLPRGRGVTIDAEKGYRFRGRRAALSEIAAWLEREQSDRRVLVVTGLPGVGKSAVLGRVVSTADEGLRKLLPPDDSGVWAPVGSVAVAVHAKGKTALDVASEIAMAASAELPEQVEELPSLLREALGEVQRGRFNVIVDALDEATSPAEARRIADHVLKDLAGICGDLGVQVVAGTRRHDNEGDLLSRLGAAARVIDLDAAEYFELEDLVAYAEACLTLVGGERLGNPYKPSEEATRTLARRIAKLADGNFLVAGLMAREHGQYDAAPVDPAVLPAADTEKPVRVALDRYLERIPAAGVLAGRDALTALAYVEAPGFTPRLWALAVDALYRTGASIDEDRLLAFARSSAANFLVEDSLLPDGPVHRLFHQALNDSLIQARLDLWPRDHDEQAIFQALYQEGVRVGWGRAAQYLLRSLAGHALRAGNGSIDRLLGDYAYLLHADLPRLTTAASEAIIDEGRERARLVRLTPEAAHATPTERAALFSLTGVMDDIELPRRDDWAVAPYLARWANTTRRGEYATLEGHSGWVSGVCQVVVRGRVLLATSGEDRTVRLWDPQSSQQCASLNGHIDGVNCVCQVVVRGRVLLASASDDQTVRLWDPETGAQRAVLEGHADSVRGVCQVELASGEVLVASASDDQTVRLWDPETGAQRAVLEGHADSVRGVCQVELASGEVLVASASLDQTVRLWDPETGAQRAVLEGHTLWGGAWRMADLLMVHTRGVNDVCVTEVGGRVLLASAGGDGTVRLWDPETGQERTRLEGHSHSVRSVCQVELASGEVLVASASLDQTVRLWDPETGAQRAVLEGHTSWATGVCAVPVGGRVLVASSSEDRTVRLWDPETRVRAIDSGYSRRADQVCVLEVGGRMLVAAASGGSILRLWDLQTGREHARLEDHGEVWGVCQMKLTAGEVLVASVGWSGVRLWDLRVDDDRILDDHIDRSVRWDPLMPQGPPPSTWDHADMPAGVCAVEVGGRMLVVSISPAGVQVWDPVVGKERGPFEGPATTLDGTGGANGVCAVTVGGQVLLAFGSSDGTVRLWDLQTGREHARLEGHAGQVWGVCPVELASGEVRVASAGSDGTVRLWDLQTGREHARLEGHADTVWGVCQVELASGEVLVVSGSQDRTVRLWDPKAGALLWTLPLRQRVLSVASRGSALVVGTETGIVVIDLLDP